MQIKQLNSGQAVGALVLLLREEDCKNFSTFSELTEGLRDFVIELISRKDFEGKKGSFLRLPVFNSSFKNLYLIGLGKKEKCDLNLIRDSLAWAFRSAGRQHNDSAAVILNHLKEFSGLSVTLGEAGGLCGYVFDSYKTKDEDYKPFALKEIYSDLYEPEEISTGEKLAAAQIFSRELINEPGCAINPAVLAQKAQELAKEYNLECEVWDENKLKAEGMGGILAVGSGSKNPPRFVHLTYKPKNNNPVKKIVFVGKGITFDSGGLNIKPDSFMLTMKGDKTGACNVLGIMKGVSELALNVEVHGLLAVAENMPSGSAYRPDDIIKARNGKTIEINNTDAEGRLVLADALCIASELKPDAIIDMATLTGACMVALGKNRAGLFSNNDELAEKVLASSNSRGELLWRMPLEDEFISKSLKSPCADLINCGERYGGAIFAALFLKEFVGTKENKIPWAHFDIAGPDMKDKEYGVYSKGASAFGVRTCLDYVINL